MTPFELCVVEADYKLRDGSQRRDTVSCSMNIASMSESHCFHKREKTHMRKRSEVTLELNLVIWCQFTDSDCVSSTLHFTEINFGHFWGHWIVTGTSLCCKCTEITLPLKLSSQLQGDPTRFIFNFSHRMFFKWSQKLKALCLYNSYSNELGISV